MEDSKFHKYYLKSNPPIDEPDYPVSPRRKPPFRSSRSEHFQRRLLKAKSEKESMTIKKETPLHDGESQFTIEEPLNSQNEYVVTISVSPKCECEDYLRYEGNHLCKHIIWVYL